MATKQASTSRPSMRRLWKAPTSLATWYWLGGSIAFFSAILVWYVYAIRTQQYPGPSMQPLLLFGIFSVVLVLITATYSLRRRFVRSLPGMVQNWLWMHTWIGITAILIAMLHENFAYITHDFLTTAGDLLEEYLGPAALFALIFLVLSGIFGRLLDVWQTRIIAYEASTNGVGITRALEERLLELEYTVERLSAGKSEAFKQWSQHALVRSSEGYAPEQRLPGIMANEQEDYYRALETLKTRGQLAHSLHRQVRAQRTIRVWRYIHMVLATISLLVILYHGVMELLTSVFNIIKTG